MERTIDVLFLVGLIVNLVKGADLILRPHQQKWVQNKCDSLALWLDYTKPIEWYVKSGFLKKWFWVLYEVAFHCLLTAYLVYRGLTVLRIFIIVTMTAISTIFLGKDLARIRLFSMLWDKLASHVTGKEYRPIDWMLAGNSYLQSIGRTSLFIVFGAIGVLLFYVHFLYFPSYVAYLRELPPFFRGFMSLLDIAIYALIVTPICIIGVANLLVLIISVSVLLIEAVLKVLRGIVWRIAEYNKGAFAAIVLVSTIGLGITEFYLKYQPVSSQTAPVQTSPSPPDTSQSPSPRPSSEPVNSSQGHTNREP